MPPNSEINFLLLPIDRCTSTNDLVTSTNYPVPKYLMSSLVIRPVYRIQRRGGQGPVFDDGGGQGPKSQNFLKIIRVPPYVTSLKANGFREHPASVRM